MKIKNYGRYGAVEDDKNVFTFEILSQDASEGMEDWNLYPSISQTYLNDNITIKVQDYLVAPYDKRHNNLPLEIRELIKNNSLLPELIEKQIRFLYGRGPFLYKKEIKNDKEIKIPIKDFAIQSWLDSWKKNGLKDDHKAYLRNCIRQYYYNEGIYSKYRFTRSRRFDQGSIVGLEVVENNDARFATKNKAYQTGFDKLDESDFKFILTGNWLQPSRRDFDVWNRFDHTDPFKYQVAINYSKNDSYGEEIYAFPVWFYGLKPWIELSNQNPKQLKSFFKNLLTAKFHVKIPGVWMDAEKKRIQSIIDKNKDLYAENKALQETYNGVELLDSADVPLDYRDTMINQRLVYELQKLTEMMSGSENAGKLFASVKYYTQNGEESWVIEEIPIKIKDFVSSLIETDNRAIDMILAGKGIDASLSNVTKEGVISKSGSDVFYNYLIYILNLSIPEDVVCADLNNAIHINFPDKTDIFIGFNQQIPNRQEDVPQNNRLENNIN